MSFISPHAMIGLTDCITKHIDDEVTATFSTLIKEGHLTIKDLKVEAFKDFNKDGVTFRSLVVLNFTDLAYIKQLEERLEYELTKGIRR